MMVAGTHGARRLPLTAVGGVGLFVAYLLGVPTACSSGKPFSGMPPDGSGASGGETDATAGSSGSGNGDAGSNGVAGGSGGGGETGQAGDGGSAGAEASDGGADGGPLTCAEGTANCNGNAADGCETTLGTAQNCARCGQACQDPQPSCEKVDGKLSCSNPAQPLSGKRIELPCVADAESVPQLCPTVADRHNACPAEGKVVKQTIKLSGAAQTLYDVTLHVRGVVEPRTYVGGKDAGNHFYIGGTGQQPSNYNTYSVVVSSPVQTFYLNADTQAESYRVFTLDHQKTIVVEGGASITLQVVDPDCAMVKNCQSFASTSCVPFVVADVPPAPQSYDGQFVQLDVVNVTLSN